MDELEIAPKDVKARLDRGEQLVLIDVREPWEHQLCRIEGARLVPLGSLAASLQALPDVDEVICYCIMACAVWTRQPGCGFRALRKQSRWLAGLNGGLLRSIRKFRDTKLLAAAAEE